MFVTYYGEGLPNMIQVETHPPGSGASRQILSRNRTYWSATLLRDAMQVISPHIFVLASKAQLVGIWNCVSSPFAPSRLQRFGAFLLSVRPSDFWRYNMQPTHFLRM